jgi:hypothetical protein
MIAVLRGKRSVGNRLRIVRPFAIDADYLFSLSANRIAFPRSLCHLRAGTWGAYKQIFQRLAIASAIPSLLDK